MAKKETGCHTPQGDDLFLDCNGDEDFQDCLERNSVKPNQVGTASFNSIQEDVFEVFFEDMSELQDAREIKKEKDKRRQQKDIFCENHLDCLVIDSKPCANKIGCSNSSTEYCDCVMICSKSVLLWESAISQYYQDKDYHIGEQKSVSGGHRILISQDQEPMVTVTFYSKRNKIMVQPGKRDEKNIISWISDFQKIKSAVSDPEETVLKSVNAVSNPKSAVSGSAETAPKSVNTGSDPAEISVNALSDPAKTGPKPVDTEYKLDSVENRCDSDLSESDSSDFLSDETKSVLKRKKSSTVVNQKRKSFIRKRSSIPAKATNTEKQIIKALQSELCKCNDKLALLEEAMDPLIEKGQTMQALIDENAKLKDLIQQKSNAVKEQNYLSRNKLDEIDTAFSVVHTNVSNLDSKLQQCEKKLNKPNKLCTCKEKWTELESRIVKLESQLLSKENATTVEEHVKNSLNDLNVRVQIVESMVDKQGQDIKSTKEFLCQPVEAKDKSDENLEAQGTDEQRSESQVSAPKPDEDKFSHINIIEDDELRDRGNVFKAYYVKVTNYAEVDYALTKIKNSQSVAPDHNFFAFTTQADKNSRFHDGEVGNKIVQLKKYIPCVLYVYTHPFCMASFQKVFHQVFLNCILV